jgi:zinc transporter 1
MVHGLSKTQRLSIAIGISFSFFAAEISGSLISE